MTGRRALTDPVRRRSFWPRGRLLGGSSNLNSMLYIRGSRHDYDNWAKMGAEGWSYKDVLPYFIKSEDNQNEEYVKSGYHGKGGPLKVAAHKTIAFTDLWLQAGREMGLKDTDPNGETMEGVVWTQATLADGVVFKDKRATGINFVRNGRKDYVAARREVILSAGAIGSPQILMLSGVGPKDHLQKLKVVRAARRCAKKTSEVVVLQIPVVADLPVGNNLHDHVYFDYEVGVKEPVGLTPEDLTSTWTRLQYYLFHTGPLVSPLSMEAQMFMATDEESRRQEWPDLQIMFMGRLWSTKALQYYRYNKETLEAAKRRDTFKYGFPCLPSLLRPKSRGTLRLRSADPFEYPAIDPRYLEHPDDVALIRLVATPTMQSIGAEVAEAPSKLCGQFKYDTDDYWECMIRRNMQTIYHPVGTCKMGAATDSNTNAPTIMVAEKAADLIKAARGK
nr:hypothetical protein BaRGS_025816 [Batillaria attramentaria]